MASDTFRRTVWPTSTPTAMKRTVWIFGLIAGAIMSSMMLATLPIIDRLGFDKGEIVAYASMIAAFLMIFFGIRSYRDSALGGTIGFGRALVVGLLITCVASACYTATWEVIYFRIMPDFATRYEQYQLDGARAKGMSEAELAKMRAEAESFARSYSNPVYNS